MTALVIDSSVAIKWYLPEEHSDRAIALQREDIELHAPDLLYVECGNVVWKRERKSELTRLDAAAILDSLGMLGIETHSSWPLVLASFEIAAATGRTVYDSLYIALALQLECKFVTADLKLCNALKGTELSTSIVWLPECRV